MGKTIDGPEIYRSKLEGDIRKAFVDHYKKCPIPDEDILQNLGLFLNSKNLSRILFMDYIYRLQINVPGVIMEFGTRWGQNTSLFAALRGIYEPFNRMKKIVGFDTFEGLRGVSSAKDNKNCSLMHEGGLSCTEGYEDYLQKIMELQEKDNPLSHVKKYDIIKGDASIEIVKYFKNFPETIISLAFFDFDIYKPTHTCLSEIKSHLVKGSIIAFDEICDHDAPGETIALQEVFGLNNVRLMRHPYTSRVSYFIFE